MSVQTLNVMEFPSYDRRRATKIRARYVYAGASHSRAAINCPKECVICHGVYVEQPDATGTSNLVPLETPASPGSDSQAIETINAFPAPGDPCPYSLTKSLSTSVVSIYPLSLANISGFICSICMGAT